MFCFVSARKDPYLNVVLSSLLEPREITNGDFDHFCRIADELVPC